MVPEERFVERQEGDLHECIRWLGRALMVDTEYEAGGASHILAELARLMEKIGVEAFTAVWEEVFAGQEPPFEDIGQVSVGLDGERERE